MAADLHPTMLDVAAVSAMRLQRIDLLVPLAASYEARFPSLAQHAVLSLVADYEGAPGRATELIDIVVPDDASDEALVLAAHAVVEASRRTTANGQYDRFPRSLDPLLDAIDARIASHREAGMPEMALVELRSMATLLRMWRAFRGSNPSQASLTAATMRSIAADVDGDPGLEHVHATLVMMVASLEGHVGEYGSMMAAMLPLADSAGLNPAFRLHVATMIATQRFLAGDWDATTLVLEEAVGRSLERLDNVDTLRAYGIVALVLTCRGEDEAAEARLLWIRTHGDLQQPSIVTFGLAMVTLWGSIARGVHDPAVGPILDGLWSSGLGGVFAGLYTAVLRARAHLASGDVAAAEGAIADAERFEYEPMAREYVLAHARALVAAHRGDGDTAAASFDAAAIAIRRRIAEQGAGALRLCEVVLAEDMAAFAASSSGPAAASLESTLDAADATLLRAGAGGWRQRLLDLRSGLHTAAHSAAGPEVASETPAVPPGTCAAATAASSDAAGIATPDSADSPSPADDDAIATAYSALAKLSTREREVARHVADGLTNREIAAALFLSVRTVEYHVRNALAKIGLRSRVDLRHLLRSGSVESVSSRRRP